MINVCEHGIIGDGKTNNTCALANLIEKMHSTGGGRVEDFIISNYSVDMVEYDGEVRDTTIMAFHIKKTKGEGIFVKNVKNALMRDISVKIINGTGIEIENSSDIKVIGLHTEGTNEISKTKNCTDVIFN